MAISVDAGRFRTVGSLEYLRPARGVPHVLGILFADYYARWCTHRMVADAVQHFASP